MAQTVRAHDRTATAPKEPRLAVETDALAAVVSKFVDGWNRERPKLPDGKVGNTSRFVSAREYLATHSGLSERTIERIVSPSGRRPTTPLRTADLLVQAIGCTDAFYNGTLPIGALTGSGFAPLDD